MLVLRVGGRTRSDSKPTWESVDARPTPAWWGDAKFGIFIHWGVYSVPAFARRANTPSGTGSGLRKPGNPDPLRRTTRRSAARRARFTSVSTARISTYQDFAPRFTAEMFDADQWADIFARSGAKYVVLVSKHHDGFALWPSREANASWGRPWNAVDVGPSAISSASSRRPCGAATSRWVSISRCTSGSTRCWLAGDVDAYVKDHLFPQFKDLVTRYSPSVIFSDGEWELPSEKWRAPELLAWLFNDSPVAQHVVVNDRWGGETRHRHGGYYTTEYGAGLPGASHAWEENRGLGHSYGFNRNEDLADYASGPRLLLTLIDTVSRGGNLLLNVGPTADGRIPVVMQDRLAFLGEWLKYNGEAIYGTRTFRRRRAMDRRAQAGSRHLH